MKNKTLIHCAVAAAIFIQLPACQTGQSHAGDILYKPGNTTITHESGETLLAPNYALTWYNGGLEKYNTGAYAGAVADFDKAVEKMQGCAKDYTRFCSYLYVYRGYALYKNKEFQKAAADYDAAIKLHPKNALAYHGRGMVRRTKKQYAGAVGDFTAAIRIKPDFAAAYHGRGLVYAHNKEYAKSIADFNRAMEITPSSLVSAYSLARVYAISGNASKALQWLGKSAGLASAKGAGPKSLLEMIRADIGDFKALKNSKEFKKITEDLETKSAH